MSTAGQGGHPQVRPGGSKQGERPDSVDCAVAEALAAGPTSEHFVRPRCCFPPAAMSILPLSFTDYKGYSYLGPRENALSCIRFITRRYVVIALVFITMSSLLFRMYWYDNIPRGLFGDVPDPVEPLGETSTSPNKVPAEVITPSPPLDPQMTEDPRWPGRRLPPLYPEWHQRDLALPQHHWHASPDDSEPKFFFVPGHTTSTFLYSLLCALVPIPSFISVDSGWGNYFEELIMNAHLAYRLKRSYVSSLSVSKGYMSNPFSDSYSTIIRGIWTGHYTATTMGSLSHPKSLSLQSFEVSVLGTFCPPYILALESHLVPKH